MNLNIGVGIHDVTGPCCDLGLMGYSDPAQKGEGIHSRLFARAFVMEDLENGKTVALVCADLLMCTQAMQLDVIKKLRKHFRGTEYSKTYSEKNVMISATHTHSAPGGYSHYLAYNASIMGFKGLNLDCIVDGICAAIIQAHKNRQPGKILVNRGEVGGCGGNRSIDAYNNNPPQEIARYSEAQDREMTLLKFTDVAGNPMGTINWFALHPTNMGQDNTLLSSDNKGYAQELFETRYPGLTAAFANSNCGDISPNIPYGEPPDGIHDFEKTKEVGERIFAGAHELFENAHRELQGNIDYLHNYIDMSCCPIEGTDNRTWPAAMGYGMSQGSMEDSLGAGKWGEGTTDDEVGPGAARAVNALLRLASSLFGIKWPGKLEDDYKKGHAPKPILFPLGNAEYKGTPLVPHVMPLQLIRLGDLVLIGHPGEITTMAGRRLRETVMEVLAGAGVNHSVIVTYTGAYSSYTTTWEEYQTQNYEGASTLYGPWTLAAYQQENRKLAQAMKEGKSIPAGYRPPDLSAKYRSRATGVKPEHKPLGANFGDVECQPASSYNRGDSVSVSFWGGHPNNNFNNGQPLMKVEKKNSRGWESVYTDKEFCTLFQQKKRGLDMALELTWLIPPDQEPGTYRIHYQGYWKKSWKKLVEIDAVSREFQVRS